MVGRPATVLAWLLGFGQGVSVAMIDRMVGEEMPSVTWGRRTRRFQRSIVLAWALEQGRLREEGAAGSEDARSPGPRVVV